MPFFYTVSVIAAVVRTVDSIFALNTTFGQSNATAVWLMIVVCHDDARRPGVDSFC